MGNNNGVVVINGGGGGVVEYPKILPPTRIQISPDSSRGVDWSASNYTPKKEFRLYYDGDNSSFSTFDDVFYELLVYKPRRTKKHQTGYKRVYKGFVHPITTNAPTKHQGSNTHNGNPVKGDTEWSVVNGMFQKTSIVINFSYFFANKSGAPLDFPLLATQTTIKKQPRMDYYIPAIGGNRKSRKLVIAFRLCGMKKRSGGGYDYTYGDMSDTIAVYPELRKNRGEASIDVLGQPINIGDTYYSGVSANFSDIPTHSDYF